MPLLAKTVNIRLLTPITPTIDKPATVMSAVPLMLDIPRMGLSVFSTFCLIVVPSASALKVFLIFIGMFFTQTG